MTMHAVLPQKEATAEPGVWLLVFGDMLIYGVMFILFALAYQQQPEVFGASQRLLGQGFGVANTLILLTSSWLVVKGIRHARAGRLPQASRWLLWAWLCGAAFVLNKLIEYSLKVQADALLTSNDFFMYYYLVTGFHLLHVLIGLVVLACMRRAVGKARVREKELVFLESGGLFWHLVDLLWIAIFPLIYLLG